MKVVHSIELNEELVDMLLVAMRIAPSKIISDFHEGAERKGLDPQKAFYDEENEHIKNSVHMMWKFEYLLKDIRAEIILQKAKED